MKLCAKAPEKIGPEIQPQKRTVKVKGLWMQSSPKFHQPIFLRGWCFLVFFGDVCFSIHRIKKPVVFVGVVPPGIDVPWVTRSTWKVPSSERPFRMGRKVDHLVGWDPFFSHCFFLIGVVIPFDTWVVVSKIFYYFDQYFSDGLKPPTRYHRFLWKSWKSWLLDLTVQMSLRMINDRNWIWDNSPEN